MASSVARPVGLAPMAVDARAVGAGGTERVVEAAREPVIVEPRGREEVGEVGWWRRRNLALLGVMKQEM